MDKLVQRGLNRLLRPIGYEVRRKHQQADVPVQLPMLETSTSLEAALQRCRARNLNVKTLIDVGASDGRWSRDFLACFPESYCFLIEANPVHQPGLDVFKQQHPRSDYVLAAAGDAPGTLLFDASDPFGGLAFKNPTDERGLVELPSTSIDTQVAAKQLQPPFAVKLDLHGFEVPVLEGAAQTLKATSLIIIEAYNFHVATNSLRFYEMVAFMENRGFSCIDFCCPMSRPSDYAFYQFDLFFVPSAALDGQHGF